MEIKPGIRVVKIDSGIIEFSDGTKLYSEHHQDCCESHYLGLDDLTMDDFKGLVFNLEDDSLFTKVEGYGIELKPLNGHPVRIPGYGSNNGYYSTNLTLILEGKKSTRSFDITECQDISGG